MNIRRKVTAAFGVALLGAGTAAVQGGVAHGQLDHNKTGTATSSQTGTGGDSTASIEDISVSINASATLTSAVGAHQNHGHISQDVHNKTHAGKVNGKTRGSARSGGQTFHIG